MEEYKREEAYRIYVTKSLQLAPQGKNLVKSYVDILDQLTGPLEEEKSADEIAADVIQKAGLKFR